MCGVKGDITISFRAMSEPLDGRSHALADWDHDLVIVDVAMTREARLRALIDLLRARLEDPSRTIART